jgi:hypothetical protein
LLGRTDGKESKTLIRTGCVLIDIRTQQLLNVIAESYSYTDLLDKAYFKKPKGTTDNFCNFLCERENRPVKMQKLLYYSSSVYFRAIPREGRALPLVLIYVV